jgi:hypothetical protein
MGQEARCTVRIGGRASEGKALLETDELVFRGDDGLRLRVPFREMKGVEARDGELQFDSSYGSVAFEVGKKAEKWAQKILHPKSLLDKLGVKAGMQVSVLAIQDPTFIDDLCQRTRNVELGSAAQASDHIFVGVNCPEDFEQVSALKRAIKPDGAVWAVFRKGRKDFNENDVLRRGLAVGLVDVKVVRFSDTHTASKFVIRKAERA